VGSLQFCTNYATGSNTTPLAQMIPRCLGCGNLTHHVNDCPTLHEKLAKGKLSRPNSCWAFASGEPIPKRSGETILAAYDRVQGSLGPASAIGLMSYKGYDSNDNQYESDDEWEGSRTKQCAGYHAYHGGSANANVGEESTMVWPVGANCAGRPMAAAVQNQVLERVTRSGGGGFRIGFPNSSHCIKDAGALQKKTGCGQGAPKALVPVDIELDAVFNPVNDDAIMEGLSVAKTPCEKRGTGKETDHPPEGLAVALATEHELIQQQIAWKIMDTDMIVSIGNLLKTNPQLSTRLGAIVHDKRNAQSAGLDKVVSNFVYPKLDKPKDKEEKITHQRALITVLLKHRRNCVQGIVNTGSMINMISSQYWRQNFNNVLST
jgi:hypothetical protein